jgi:predicted nucleic acid-binding protein
MKVVSNTTPLIGLASIDHFELLHLFFDEITIPQAVYDETVVAGREEGGAKQEVSSAKWINVASVRDQLAVEVLLDELDRGEAEVIVLAREMKADLVLMDEKKGRRKLNQLGINKIGTVGILLKAKEIGHIESLEKELSLLRENGFSISQYVVDRVLQQANKK